VIDRTYATTQADLTHDCTPHVVHLTHLFTGKERDSESGLDYFGARYLSSNMGRFMSPDWSDDPDPIPHADTSNPQSLNRYAYVLNNPLSNADQNGHACVGGVEALTMIVAEKQGQTARKLRMVKPHPTKMTTTFQTTTQVQIRTDRKL